MSIDHESLFVATDSSANDGAQNIVPTDSTPAAAEKNPGVAACLIEYARGRFMAFPPHTTYGLIDCPTVLVVPGAAHYAYGLMAWQNNHLPLLNLDALLHSVPCGVGVAAPSYALIVAYQPVARGPLSYGAIGLETLPQTIMVSDKARCALPEDSYLWPSIALSCFQHAGRRIPIIDSSRLFSAYHRGAVE